MTTLDATYKEYVNYHTIYDDEPDGHRLWYSRSGSLFIFDRSGDDPLDCDDPPIRIPARNGAILCSGDGMRLTPIGEYDYQVRINSKVAAYLVNDRDYSLTVGEE